MKQKILKIISDVCLKHRDSGESSVNREARLIVDELEKNGYVLVKRQNVENMVTEISKGWYPYQDGKLEKGDTGIILSSSSFVNSYIPELRTAWFMERIGKRVYRHAPLSCSCDSCKRSLTEGVLIDDETVAQYLSDASGEMGIDYHDTPKK
jgi:hypothetical protein